MTAPERPRKRSLTLQGHRTSVSMEEIFWVEFRRLATKSGQSVNALAAQLDETRVPPASLASVIRVFVLNAVKRGE